MKEQKQDYKEKKKSKKENKEIQKLKEQNDEYLNGWKRAQADYMNLKKESEQKSADLAKFASMKMVTEILPVMKNFSVALESAKKTEGAENIVQGFEYIKKQLDDILENVGVKEMQTQGQKFDPELHEAVAHEERDDMEDGMITEEITKGYIMNNRVIEPARVKVSKKQDNTSSKEERKE